MNNINNIVKINKNEFILPKKPFIRSNEKHQNEYSGP